MSPFYAQASYSLGYDNTDEITSGSTTGSSYGYSYDAGGNRLTETINGSTTTATCNAVNQLQQLTPAKPGDKTYQWDAADRLIGINYTGTGEQTKLSYDGMGRCAQIQELTNGAVTITRRFLWCGLKRCEERDGFDNVTKRFFQQGEQIYGQPYYFFKDHLGSIWEMTDSTGAVRASYKYDLWGRRTKLTGDLDADMGFTGLFYHLPSQLCDAVFREYDPNTGRWLSRDPLGEGADATLYSYVGNRPTVLVDILGLAATITYTNGSSVTTSSANGFLEAVNNPAAANGGIQSISIDGHADADSQDLNFSENNNTISLEGIDGQIQAVLVGSDLANEPLADLLRGRLAKHATITLRGCQAGNDPKAGPAGSIAKAVSQAAGPGIIVVASPGNVDESWPAIAGYQVGPGVDSAPAGWNVYSNGVRIR